MANFSNEEIVDVLNNSLSEGISTEKIDNARNEKKGLNQIIEKERVDKVGIGKELIQNLFDKYEETEDESIFERPIFKAFKKLRELATKNHLPVNRKIESKNKEYILNILNSD